MPIYNCDICNYETNHKTKYTRHQKSNKHLAKFEVLKRHPIVAPMSSQGHPNSNKTCTYCGQVFAFKQGKYRHMKNSCKEKNKENLKEKVDMLIEEVAELKNKLKDKNSSITETDVKDKDKTKEVELVDFYDTDNNLVTDNEFKNCIKDSVYRDVTHIKYVHFNKKHPEHQNIFINNLNSKFVNIYTKNKWEVVSREDVIDDLLYSACVLVDYWMSENETKYPSFKQIYDRCKATKENEENKKTARNIKSKVVALLYNGRSEKSITEKKKKD